MLNWYLQSGKESDVVISVRIRIARNLLNNFFINRCTTQETQKIREKIEKTIFNMGYGLKLKRLKDLNNIEKMSLIEKHIISPEFAVDEAETGSIFLNEEENICIMINEEDHIRIQVLASGFELENSLNLALEIEEKIGQLLNYAYDEKYGFLTSCPTNVGTGLRASVMVHLPALTLTGNIVKVLDVVRSFGMNIRGIYGEGSKSQGNVYQISNKQSLGITEQEIIRNIKIITEKIIEQERIARKLLAKKSIALEDRVYRAYGLLVNCKKISSEEAKILLSEVKLGVDMGIIKELTDLKVKKLELYTKPANLQIYANENITGDYRDVKRAEIIKNIINE